MIKHEKKLSKFAVIMIICWAAALAALAVCMLILRSYLADYESVQPKYAAEKVFSEYFSPVDYEALLEYADESLTKFNKKEALVAYLSTLTDGKELSYHNVSTGVDADAAKYIVKYSEDGQDIKIASFTLRKSDEKSPKGFSVYKLSEAELFFPASVCVQILVQNGYTPYVSGKALDESYIVEADIPSDANAHLPEGVGGVFFSRYEVGGLVEVPEIEIKSPAGEAKNAFLDEESGCYEAVPDYDDALAEEYTEYVIKAAELYATYMQNDCSFGKISPYFESGTQLYNDIRTTTTAWVIDHDSYHFEDEEASEFYRYDENTFSCRIKLTHVLKRSRLEDYKDYVDITFYLRKSDGKYLIYDRTNN